MSRQFMRRESAQNDSILFYFILYCTVTHCKRILLHVIRSVIRNMYLMIDNNKKYIGYKV